MKRVEAILRVERLRIVKEHLKEIGIGGIIIHVSGWSKENTIWRIEDDLYPIIYGQV